MNNNVWPLAAVLLVGACTAAEAGNVTVNYGTLKQHISYLDESVTLAPDGPGLSLSVDLHDNWSADGHYQRWQDKQTHEPWFIADQQLISWGIGLGHYQGDWSYSASYSVSEDDSYLQSIQRPLRLNRSDHTQMSSLGLGLGYGWASGEWFYNSSLALQSGKWDSLALINTPTPPPPPPGGGQSGGQSGGQGGGQSGGQGGGQGGQPPPPDSHLTRETASGDVLSASVSMSAARFWSLNESQGLLTGAMLSWNYTFSGESQQLVQAGRNPPRGSTGSPGRGGPAGNNAAGRGINGLTTVSGDDNYGQLSLYLSFDLNELVSLDVDWGLDIGTDHNDQRWSLSLGYYW